jgi:uncharacterized membrane protein
MPSDHLKDHIAIIAKHEEDFLGARTTAERVADLLGAFVGSFGFVAIHVVWFTTWILINTEGIGTLRRFDHTPFPLRHSRRCGSHLSSQLYRHEAKPLKPSLR